MFIGCPSKKGLELTMQKSSEAIFKFESSILNFFYGESLWK